MIFPGNALSTRALLTFREKCDGLRVATGPKSRVVDRRCLLESSLVARCVSYSPTDSGRDITQDGRWMVVRLVNIRWSVIRLPGWEMLPTEEVESQIQEVDCSQVGLYRNF